jgi:hypothetical protein
MDNNIKLSKTEFYRLLNQCMVLDNILKNFKSNNFKLEASTELLKNHYEVIHEEVCDTIRVASKKLERLYQQELKEKESNQKNKQKRRYS